MPLVSFSIKQCNAVFFCSFQINIQFKKIIKCLDTHNSKMRFKKVHQQRNLQHIFFVFVLPLSVSEDFFLQTFPGERCCPPGHWHGAAAGRAEPPTFYTDLQTEKEGCYTSVIHFELQCLLKCLVETQPYFISEFYLFTWICIAFLNNAPGLIGLLGCAWSFSFKFHLWNTAHSSVFNWLVMHYNFVTS